MRAEHRFVKILAVVEALTAKYGYPPTYREIGDQVGLRSQGDAHKYVHKLIARGFLTQEPGSPRTLRRTKKAWK